MARSWSVEETCPTVRQEIVQRRLEPAGQLPVVISECRHNDLCHSLLVYQPKMVQLVKCLQPIWITLVPRLWIPRKTSHLGSSRYAQEVNKSDVLVSDYFHLVNEAKPAKLIAKLFFCHTFIQTTDINVPAGITLTNCQRYLRRYRGWFTPANL